MKRAGFAPPIALAAVALFAIGCYPKAAPPPGAVSAEQAQRSAARWPGLAPGALVTGRDLFIAKCNECHGYPDLRAIPDDKWPHIVESMGKKANLGPKEQEDVLHFILTSRADATGH